MVEVVVQRSKLTSLDANTWYWSGIMSSDLKYPLHWTLFTATAAA